MGSPTKPGGQEQSKPPGELIHMALEAQLLRLGSAHSLRSAVMQEEKGHHSKK